MNSSQVCDGVDEDFGDELSAPGGGENKESTGRCSFSESGGVGSSSPSSGILTTSMFGSGTSGRGSGASGNRGGRRHRSNN